MPKQVDVTLSPEEWAEVCSALRSAAIRYNDHGQELHKVAGEPGVSRPAFDELAKQFWSQAEYCHKYANHIDAAVAEVEEIGF